MNKKLTLLVLCVATVLATSPAFAKDTKKKSGVAPTESVRPVESSYGSSSYGSSSGRSPGKIAVGLSTQGVVSGSSTSLTGTYELNNGDLLQGLFNIAATSPSFDFAVGALYKHSIVEHGSSGFHAGAGVGLGSIAKKFAFAVPVFGGFHFSLPSLPQITASVDGGPILAIVDGNANFGILALSPALGLSLTYTL